MTSTAQYGDYQINLRVFAGPMDLLLHLIKTHNVDICDIPIAMVTEQYLAYLGAMQELNLDLASEYLLMASELAYIKSRMMLPYDPLDEAVEQAEEDGDPRADLVRRLLDYQKYKEAARRLAERPMLGEDLFARDALPDEIREQWATRDSTFDVTIFELVRAYRELVTRLERRAAFTVHGEEISLTDCIAIIVNSLKRNERVSFDALFGGAATKAAVVGTFLALLEMTRLKMIQIYQNEPFGILWVIAQQIPDVEPAAIIGQIVANLEGRETQVSSVDIDERPQAVGRSVERMS